MSFHQPELPLRQTLGYCYLEIRHAWRQILLICALPFFLNMLLYIVPDLLLTQHYTENRAVIAYGFFILPSSLIIYPLTALLLFRFLLLGKYQRFFDIRFSEFMCYGKMLVYLSIFLLGCFLLFVLFAGLWIIAWHSLSFLQPVIGIFYFLSCLYLLTRIGFVFPAAATDTDYTLRDSLYTTKAVHLKLFTLTSAMVLPPLVLLFSLREMLEHFAPITSLSADEYIGFQLNISYWFWVISGNFLSFLFLILLVIVATVTFYLRTGWKPGAHKVS